MTSKYHGLPDIDTAPDIFETPDEPDALLRPADNGLGNDEGTFKTAVEGLDHTSLPGRKKAQKVFGRGTKRVDPTSLSFRPRLPPLSRHYSSSGSSSGSEDELPRVPRESAVARLRRLKAELAEVESELNTGGAPDQSQSTPTSVPSSELKDEDESSSRTRAESSTAAKAGEGKKRKSALESRKPIDVFSELSGLKARLENIDLDQLDPEGTIGGGAGSRSGIGESSGSEWTERLERLKSIQNRQQGRSGDSGQEDASLVNEEANRAAGSSLGEIDRRLASLESTLGPIGNGLDQSSPLIPTLDKHDHLLTLLTQPRHLDAISRRIKLLLVDLDRAATASRRSGGVVGGGGGGGGGAGSSAGPSSGANAEKGSSTALGQAEYDTLQSLFNILPRLDPLLPIISPLLLRLRSLSNLHAETSEMVDSLKRLQDEDKSSTEELGELSELVSSVEKGLAGATESVVKNWQGVEGRLNSLEQRLRSLEG